MFTATTRFISRNYIHRLSADAFHRDLICGASKHKCAVTTVNGTRWCAWYHRLYIYILMVVYGLLYIDAEVNDKLQHMHMTGRWVRFYLGSLGFIY